MNELLLLTPPFTQLNTPYPAAAYLKGFLNTKGISAFQMDLGIEVILKLFSGKGLEDLFQCATELDSIHSENTKRIFQLRQDYLNTIDEVIAFLQGRNSHFGRLIATENFLPEAGRFDQLEELDWAFGTMGVQDKAKHLATLYLEDLSDFIIECVDPHFGFSRYAERLGRSANSFNELHAELENPLTYIDRITIEILLARVREHQPRLICMSVPFPGNLYSAFRCAKAIRQEFPDIRLAMGGGFPNTELRSLKEPKVFDYFHFITLDDGELPIELLAKQVLGGEAGSEFKRTFLRENGAVCFRDESPRPDYKQSEVGCPDYSDLPLDRYISAIEVANPMHSLWSDGRWNKLTMAHGCYWGKCTFCDVSLDYIRLYEPIAAKILVDRVEQLIEQTGERGFHFVDEAAPPALMREFALEILRRGVSLSWWTNIRFEKSFSADLCRLLKASGCIAVSGGLEVASNRLLALIEKGVTVEQVARVTRDFTESGIMVHAYLMYGYPTQTEQETIDSLEMVRQLFEAGVLQSGFWHQFALTAHSPVGLAPAEYGIHPDLKEITFAHNDIAFTDSTGIDHEKFSFGLKKSLFNYMHGIGFEFPLRDWFDFSVPKSRIKPDFIQNSLEEEDSFGLKPNAKLVWLGGDPLSEKTVKRKKGREWEQLRLTIHNRTSVSEIILDEDKGTWLAGLLPRISARTGQPLSLSKVKTEFEEEFEHFELFWFSKPLRSLREAGLLVL